MNKDLRTLYIHIGNHKTGTTSIQKALVSHKKYLSDNGISLFHENPNGSLRNIGNVHTWMNMNLKSYLNANVQVQQGVKNGFIEQVAKAGNTVLVSSESFSYFFDKKSLQGFVNNCYKYFDAIKVLVYIRRQDLQVVSQHQQGSKEASLGAAKLYGNRPRALPLYTEKLDYYLNYSHRLGLWAELIGDENLSIRLFDKKILKNGDVVDDFFACLGLQKQFDSELDNQSLGFIRTKVGHLINQANIPLSRSKALRGKLDNNGKLLPSRQDALEFYSYYRESNRILNQRFKLNEQEYLFSEDFSVYPESDGDLWNEEKANLAIKTVLSSLKSTPVISIKKISYLRSLLPELKSKDANLAKEFEKLLLRLQKQTESKATLSIKPTSFFNKLKKKLKPYYHKILSLFQYE